MKRELVNELRNLRELQELDENMQNLKSKQPKNLRFLVDNGIIYCRTPIDEHWRIITPEDLVPVILWETHKQLCHVGEFKMFKYLSQFFYWNRMRRDIKLLVKGWNLCQRIKYFN